LFACCDALRTQGPFLIDDCEPVHICSVKALLDLLPLGILRTQ
jgi:hypothetical protein